MDWYTNKHGVKVMGATTGTMFGRRLPDGTFGTNLPLEVPECCATCKRYDYGEPGEYGEMLSGPSCGVYLRFPTKTGKCGRRM